MFAISRKYCTGHSFHWTKPKFFTHKRGNKNIMSDILFSTIEKFQANIPWGRVLDAGTGLHSLKWLLSLNTVSWTAITADQFMKSQILKDESVKSNIRSDDLLLVGNWMDEGFTQNLGKYDTILADYLIGAVDGFSPYDQDEIIKK